MFTLFHLIPTISFMVDSNRFQQWIVLDNKDNKEVLRQLRMFPLFPAPKFQFYYKRNKLQKFWYLNNLQATITANNHDLTSRNDWIVTVTSKLKPTKSNPFTTSELNSCDPTEPLQWFRPFFQGFQGQDFKITSRSPP